MAGRGLPVKESALLFGRRKSLVGVICEPSGGPAPDRPAVILLNAGVLHRVGPNRINVRLARELARHGFVSLRFDFSGLGDSRPRGDATPFADATVEEGREAMDVLAGSRGVGTFILAGLCSGADNALRLAEPEDRVVGAALIEPYSVPAPGFLLYSYRRKLLSPIAWWRLLRGRSEVLERMHARRGRVPERPVAGVEADAAAAPATLLPSPRAFARQVRLLLDRGTELLFAYSAESPAYFNYLSLLRRELRPALGEGRARLAVLRRTDHVFTPLAVQERLLGTVRDWSLGVAARGLGVPLRP